VGCVCESFFRLTSFLFRLVFSGFWVLVRLRSHLSSAVYVPRCPARVYLPMRGTVLVNRIRIPLLFLRNDTVRLHPARLGHAKLVILVWLARVGSHP
jgi:hypothetical protein